MRTGLAARGGGRFARRRGQDSGASLAENHWPSGLLSGGSDTSVKIGWRGGRGVAGRRDRTRVPGLASVAVDDLLGGEAKICRPHRGGSLAG